jgi:hypothetical protein
MNIEVYNVEAISFRWKWEARTHAYIPYLGDWSDSLDRTAKGKTPQEAIDKLKAKLCKLCAKSDAKRQEIEAYDSTRVSATFVRSRDCSG